MEEAPIYLQARQQRRSRRPTIDGGATDDVWRLEVSGRFWPIFEPAQADYEQLRAIAVQGGSRRDSLRRRA